MSRTKRTFEKPRFAHIDEITPRGETDTPALQDVGAVLSRFGMNDRVNVTLLHGHNIVGPGETLVQTIDRKNRQIVVKSRASRSLPSNAIPTSWYLGPVSVGASATPETFYIDDPGNHADAAQLSGLFESLAEALNDHRAINRFGVALDPSLHLDVKEGETLLEDTNEDLRSQIIRPVPIDHEGSERAIETAWEIWPDGDLISPQMGCVLVKVQCIPGLLDVHAPVYDHKKS